MDSYRSFFSFWYWTIHVLGTHFERNWWQGNQNVEMWGVTFSWALICPRLNGIAMSMRKYDNDQWDFGAARSTHEHPMFGQNPNQTNLRSARKVNKRARWASTLLARRQPLYSWIPILSKKHCWLWHIQIFGVQTDCSNEKTKLINPFIDGFVWKKGISTTKIPWLVFIVPIICWPTLGGYTNQIFPSTLPSWCPSKHASVSGSRS